MKFPKLPIKKYGKESGFTLVELLVVVAIIGMLSAVILTTTSTVRARSRDARRKADATQMMKALELYYAANNAYPDTASINGGWVLSNTADWTTLGTTLSSVLTKMPTDPRQTGSGTVYNTSTVYSYAIYSAQFGGCLGGQWYVLVYKLENTDSYLPTRGYTCDGTLLDYTSGGNNITYVVRASR